ncbi:MAG: glycoside hydrolase family 65 protein [Chloroflexi bacterium]|nr:MAG: glycoside hydrolase family 65 protein [Chloroflexota bacterium]
MRRKQSVNLWHIIEDNFDPKKMYSQGSVYTIGNGYFATRGTFEENYFGAKAGTLLYGVFDDIGIGKEELANAPDWLPIKLFVNGERFHMTRGKILEYQRTLDFHNGVLTRTVRWESPSGIRLRIHIERFANLADEHVGAIRYSVTVEEKPPEIHELKLLLRATFNIAVSNDDVMHWEPLDQWHEDELIWFLSRTRHSSIRLLQTMSFTTQTPGFSREILDSDTAPSIELQGKLAKGETITAEKIVMMYTTHDDTDPVIAAFKHHRKLMGDHGAAQQSDTNPSVYEALLAQNELAWQDYWKCSDIIIEGDDKAQQAVRYNLYQLRISVNPHDSRFSIAAKGLTGFGYHGHVFHDTEIYMLPYFTYVHPDIARTLLLYRYNLLPAAREKAKGNGFEGAQFPWESTLDGKEATPEVVIHPETKELIPIPNGYIELHITANIAYAFQQYWQVTGDDQFMRDYGAEVLLSTAMFQASRAEPHPELHAYEINDVIGPDEWHEHVNNNAYTNAMAKWNIQWALHIMQWLHLTAPDKAKELTQRLHLTKELLEHWQDVAEHIRVPQDKETGLFEQFDGFFLLEPLDLEKFKGRRVSYQGILGLEQTNHYRIIKQADVLALITLLRQQFDINTKQVNWDYYFPITDHDYGSSLTPALHVILACQLGYLDIAYDLFLKGALVDLEDRRENTTEGIHEACCGAVWQAIILGFAGLQVSEESYTVQPSWPHGWTRIAFNFLLRGEPVFVDLRKE